MKIKHVLFLHAHENLFHKQNVLSFIPSSTTIIKHFEIVRINLSNVRRIFVLTITEVHLTCTFALFLHFWHFGCQLSDKSLMWVFLWSIFIQSYCSYLTVWLHHLIYSASNTIRTHLKRCLTFSKVLTFLWHFNTFPNFCPLSVPSFLWLVIGFDRLRACDWPSDLAEWSTGSWPEVV